MRTIGLPIIGVILVLQGAVLMAGEPDGFRLGVCCHPGHTRTMPIDWEGVFGWISGCGADLCRIDWGADWEQNEQILAAAEKAGVELLPVVFPPAPKEDTEEAWYEASKAYGREAGRRYKGRIRYFELSNERDCLCMTKWPGGGDRDGASMGDYDEEKYAPIRGMLRGLAEGLRETHPESLRIIDAAGWLHFGFIDLLVRDEVPFDILAWHWYSEMQDMTKPVNSYSGTYVVLDKLTSYGKPVWLTEGNARNGTLGRTEQEQADYLVETIKSLRDSGKVGVYVAYELFDEPYLFHSGGEAFYGIVHCEWGLSEGNEFPGAQGSIAVREVAGRKALVLGWDFSKGGRYVSANWEPRAQVPGDELRLTVRGEAGIFAMLLRFVDATGQHLQMAPNLELTGDWQEFCVPIKAPWADSWAGKADGVVHQPLRGIWIGARSEGPEAGEVAISRAALYSEGELSYEFDSATDDVFVPKAAWERLKEEFGD